MKPKPIMTNYEETQQTWNKVASLYQEKFMDLDLYNETYDLICTSIIKPDAKILEIGCGPGNITKYLLGKRPDFDVFGIDVAPNMVVLAKNNNPTATFSVMDCRQIDELKTKYDGIVCGFCLPYLSPADCAKFINDCYHLLEENGLIYISFVEGEPSESGFKVASTGDRSYFYFYDLDELIKQLGENEFGEMKVFKVEYKRSESEMETHTIIVATKKSMLEDDI